MNLLLLLSALLSALTGAGVGARAPQVAVTVSRTAEAAVTRVAPVRIAGRPVAALPALKDVAFSDAPAFRFAPAAPLYLSRRRE